MLAEEHELWFAMLEPHKRVLPVADMVPETHIEDLDAEIVAVEVEPKCIDNAVAFVYDDQDGRRIAATASGGSFLYDSGVCMGVLGLVTVQLFSDIGDVLLAA